MPKLHDLPLAAALIVSVVVALPPSQPWVEHIDLSCCPYPERDPRDYNYPYSNFQYSEVIPDVVGTFVSMTEILH